ncbi:MAG: hypothetical protein HGB33_01160 [Syntrophaceae bacterium]|nr:hypothetical protein [Syntrophaceae bacterium]
MKEVSTILSETGGSLKGNSRCCEVKSKSVSEFTFFEAEDMELLILHKEQVLMRKELLW